MKYVFYNKKILCDSKNTILLERVTIFRLFEYHYRNIKIIYSNLSLIGTIFLSSTPARDLCKKRGKCNYIKIFFN